MHANRVRCLGKIRCSLVRLLEPSEQHTQDQLLLWCIADTAASCFNRPAQSYADKTCSPGEQERQTG